MLEKQTYPVGKIIVMNTEKAFWNEKGFEGIGNLHVHHLTKAEFDHGATRKQGNAVQQGRHCSVHDR